nr:MAG TPA: hypothetical protein [Caudoviricetes sp.]
MDLLRIEPTTALFFWHAKFTTPFMKIDIIRKG